MKKQVLPTVVARRSAGQDAEEITISTAALDRDSDELVPDGMDASDYLKNPVVLFGHDYRSLPVAMTTALSVDAGRSIRARFTWLENDPFADRVRNAYQQGALRAASVGFIPVASEPNGKGGLRFTKWSLTEWSLVPVPCNPEAVRVLKGLDLWRDDDVVLDVEEAEPVYTYEQIANAYRALGTHRRGEPYEPIYDVNATEVRAMLHGVVRQAIGDIVRDVTTSTIRRRLGKVD